MPSLTLCVIQAFNPLDVQCNSANRDASSGEESSSGEEEEEDEGPSEEELKAIARAEALVIIKDIVKDYKATREWIEHFKELLVKKGINVPTVHILPKVTEEMLL